MASLRYKRLELLRNRELLKSKGNYDSIFVLPDKARQAISWWITNIHAAYKFMCTPPPSVDLFTDASLSGWGAVRGNAVARGHWAASEISHINVLELKTVLLGLQALCRDLRDVHVRLHVDNTTAVACINRCGSMKEALLSVCEQIFEWACERNVTISAEHIKGIHNVEADFASRIGNV